MDSLYIAASIPAFFLLIGVELWVNWKRGNPRYRFADSITNLSCGVGSLIVDIAVKGAVFAIYVAVFEHARLFDLPLNAWWVWLLAFLGTDLCYYWFHRTAHRVNILWAGHVAHHQSEEYNLSVALRQSWYVPFYVWAYYLPLILLGFPPVMVLAHRTLNTLYQFWIHTEAIGRLGPLEWIFNTPSHHRVHHGINPRYIDKNYAGIFILWDRLFGTFEPESEEVVYGLVRPLQSFNPLWANVHRFVEMWRVAAQSSRWSDRLKIWFKGPEWLPHELGGIKQPPPISRAQQAKYHAEGVPAGLNRYVAVSFVLVALATTGLLYEEPRLSQLELVLASTFIMGGLIAWGGLFERKSWAVPLEVVRWLAGVAFVAHYTAGTAWWVHGLAASIGVALASLTWVSFYRRMQPPAEGRPASA